MQKNHRDRFVGEIELELKWISKQLNRRTTERSQIEIHNLETRFRDLEIELAAQPSTTIEDVVTKIEWIRDSTGTVDNSFGATIESIFYDAILNDLIRLNQSQQE